MDFKAQDAPFDPVLRGALVTEYAGHTLTSFRIIAHFACCAKLKRISVSRLIHVLVLIASQPL